MTTWFRRFFELIKITTHVCERDFEMSEDQLLVKEASFTEESEVAKSGKDETIERDEYKIGIDSLDHQNSDESDQNEVKSSLLRLAPRTDLDRIINL